MKLELITENRVSNLPLTELIEFVLDKVMDNSILLVERKLDAEERMEIMKRGLEVASNRTSMGLKMLNFSVKKEISGRIRNKVEEVYFNLFAPGSSVIQQEDDGHFSIHTYEGEPVAEV